MQITAALDRFVLHLRADGRSENTTLQYQRHVRLLARWANETGHDGEVEHVTPELLARFLVSDAARLRPDGRPKKASALNSVRTSLRIAFAWFHRAVYTPEYAAALVRRARTGTPPPRALSADEQRRLLAVLDTGRGRLARRDAVLFRVMLQAGLRVGELVALDVEDLDLDGEAPVVHIRRSKNDRPARMPLVPDLVARLRAHVGDRVEGPLFLARGGRRVTTRQVRRRLAGWLERAEVARAASPHSLRHSFATDLYARTSDVFLVQTALRHRCIGSTLVYARCSEGRLRAAMGA